MRSRFASVALAALLLAIVSAAAAGPFDSPTLPSDPEAQAIEKAKVHLRLRHPEKAIDVLRQALTRRPNSARLRHHLGLAYVQNGKPELAAAQFKTAIELDKQFPDPHTELARIALRKVRVSDPQARAKNLVLVKEAISQYRSAFDKTPEALRSNLHYNLAQLYVDSVRFRDTDPEEGFDQALEVLETARKQSPDEERPHMALGNVRVRYADHLAAGKPLTELTGPKARKANDLLDRAVNHFRKVLDINPRFLDALNKTASIHQARGHVDKAVRTISDHLARLEKPDEKAVCLRWMGQYLRRGDKLDEAKKKLDQAIDTNPKDLASYLLLANVLIRLDKPDEAVATLNKALELEPRFINAHVELGVLEERRQHPARAAKHFEAALDIPSARAAVVSPGGKSGRQALFELYTLCANKLARFHLAGNRDENAITVYRNLADLIPGSPVPDFHIGQIHRRFGRIDEAREHYDNALKLNRNFVPARAALADLEALELQKATTPQERAEAIRRAIGQYERALDAQPWNPAFLDRLAALHARLAHNKGPVDRDALEQALEYSERAVKAAEDKTPYRRRLAFIHHELGSDDRAVEQIHKIIDRVKELQKESPDNARLTYRLAELRSLLHRWKPDPQTLQTALAGFEEAAEKEPGFVEPRLQAARLLEDEKRYKEAVVWFKKMLEAARGETPLSKLSRQRSRFALHAAAELAWIYCEHLDDPEMAMDFAKVGTQINPDLPSLVDTIGWIHYKNGAYNEALLYLRRASQKAPGNATVRYHLGAALAKANNKDRAREELRQALKDVGDDTELRDKINQALQGLGR
ncbi:MAG: tetratricopeptide repeat protein [Planctomycetota bacterium]